MLRVLRHGVGSFLLLALLTGCVLRGHANRHVSTQVVIKCTTDICVDDGFDVQSDGFSFPNWNGVSADHSSVDIPMLVAMFGHEMVCRPGAASVCTPTPRALHLIDEWNTALRGGRCEGMAVLSERMFIELARPHDFDDSVDTAAQLSRGNEQLENEITYWWATQFTDDISAIAHTSRQRTPSEIVQQLIHGLSTSAGYTLALYDRGMGHSFTPFAVTEISNGWRIHVYDNNYPGVDNHIDVNSTTEQWTYVPQQANTASSVPESISATQWSGSTGAIELTPMKARSGPFQCSTCDDQSGLERDTEDVVISLLPLSRHGEVGLEIVTADGTISTLLRQPQRDNGIDIMMSKDGTTPRLTRVRIPADLQPFDIRVISSPLTVMPPPVLVTVSHPGVASVHLRGMLARAHSMSKSQSNNAPTLSVNSSGLQFHTDVATSASVALTADIAEMDIQPGHRLAISRLRQSEVSITDGQNNAIFSDTYRTPELLEDSVVQRHVLTLSQGKYTVVDVDIPSVVIPSDPVGNITGRGNTERNSPQPSSPVSSVPDAMDSSQSPTPTMNVATSLPTTTLPSPKTPPISGIVMTAAATPHLLHVDDRDSAWLRIGNQRALTRVFANGTHMRREIDGIPIAATQDDVGALWVLLQQPERLVQVTPTSLTYHSHPQLNAPTSIAFSPKEREIVITGGRTTSAYIATISSPHSFDFRLLTGITQPGLLTLDAQSNPWFVDLGGGSTSRINTDRSIETFQRSTVMARSLALGPDNAMWFVNNVAGYEIGRISAKGTYSFTSAPAEIDTLRDITSANGVLWFTARASLVRMNLDMTTTIITDTHPWGQSSIKPSVTSGAVQSLWYINTNFFTLSRITM